ncbi:MAG: hypothetical protein B7Y25_00015 [Alphaproteobacteria bacterium 16-39-46]|nr:MAG: hypothetical protein B7Y25_00015 [Alphaproteobacteria bacterium 16-39-46]OZA44556.1 MAG: hypothetical protein B7X84_00305 [Alphaproteobacteria bacterium 17-39-52]
MRKLPRFHKMMTPFFHPSFSLAGPSLGPAAGHDLKTCVILLHGLGSNGENLMDLGRCWHTHLPETAFFAPNAPFPYEMGPSFEEGYQWFKFDSQHPSYIDQGIQKALPYLSRYVDEILDAFSLSPQKIVLAGFSQGAMMALAFGLQCRQEIGGILAYSGGLFGSVIPSPIYPSLCLIHGEEDVVVPPRVFLESKRFLKDQKIPFQSHLLKNLSHTIDERGIDIGLTFIKTCFEGEQT